MALLKLFLVVTSLSIAGVSIYLMTWQPSTPVQDVKTWWGSSFKPVKINTAIRPFKVNVGESELKDLQSRLNRSRINTDLEDSRFQYGFNLKYLKEIQHYWLNDYDWIQHQSRMNQHPQYKVHIDGLDIHYVHIKTKPKNNKGESVPLMLIHGWPGSFWEFYKTIPAFTEAGLGIDLIIPSIPGYGFSDPPRQKGFDVTDAARIFHKLMVLLDYQKYFIQGGDWGSVIAAVMAQINPDHVYGIHINMITAGIKPSVVAYKIATGLLPSLMMDSQEMEYYRGVGGLLKVVLNEGGYFHMHATKPNTQGVGLNDSPLGLAAYILEKFSTWTNPENVNSQDGGIKKSFTLDDVLTNVMIYWHTSSITSSIRFYKETLQSEEALMWSRCDVIVPAALAYFKHELINEPLVVARQKFRDIRQVTYMPEGGHFAAVEQPELLANDVIKFILSVI